MIVIVITEVSDMLNSLVVVAASSEVVRFGVVATIEDVALGVTRVVVLCSVVVGTIVNEFQQWMTLVWLTWV